MARIAIVGPGSIGCVMGAWLSSTGAHEVVLCARRPLGTVTVETPDRTLTVRATVATDPSEVSSVDWILLATKTYDVPCAAAWLATLGANGAPVAVLQNGVDHRERLASYVAAERVLPVLVYCPSERSESTRVRQRRAARLVVQDDVLGRAFADLFSGTQVAVAPTADLTTALWEKLCLNAAGAVNALSLRPTGVFREAGPAELARSLMRECIAVGRAEGAHLDDGLIERTLAFYHASPPDTVNSLHADRVAGRPMEIDARNGVIVRLGRKHGIATPYNHMAVVLLEAAVGARIFC